MTDVCVGNIMYRDADLLTPEKLTPLLHLAELEIEEYKQRITHYTPQQMLCYGNPYIEKLEHQRDCVAQLLTE